MNTEQIVREVASHADDSRDARIALYNALTSAASRLVADVCADPALSVQLLPVSHVHGNNYNPNRVSPPEIALLEESIRADGVTMPCVVMPDGLGYVVIDGFHRREVIAEKLNRSHIPCTVIIRPEADRMASTIRHNRARGKHGVELMGAFLKRLIALDQTDGQIARKLGMSMDELLRLKQVVGAASILAGKAYTRAWRGRDGQDSAD